MSRSTAVLLLTLSLAGPAPSWGEPAGAGAVLTLGPGEPDHLVQVAAACPTFHWGSTSGPGDSAPTAGGFELVVAEVVEGDEGVTTHEVLRRRLPAAARLWTPHLADCLERGALYGWRLRPLDEAGTAGDWTRARYFEVVREPSVAEIEAALAVLRDVVENRDGAGAGEPAGAEETATAPKDPGVAAARDVARRRTTARVDAGADRVAIRGRGGDAGRTIGVVGDSASEVDGSIGVVGESTATAGATIGVAGQAASAAGTAGVFDNLAGGKLLSGRVAGVERFVVTGAGDVAATSFAGDGSALSGVDAALLDGLEATAFMPADADDWVDTTGDTMTGDLVLSGADIDLGSGALRRGADLFLHGRGVANTALGLQALAALTDGEANTALGASALTATTTGSDNTAVGRDALGLNLIGTGNTAVGRSALRNNVANGNSALGNSALRGNTTGFDNTAVGSQALTNNTTGTSNVAVGGVSLFSNTSGTANTAVGSDALQANGTGHNNTAIGEDALRSNGSGSQNTAVGAEALRGATGSGNIGLGYRAGHAVDGSANVMIAHPGLAADNATIRIGDSAQSRTFVAGIRGATTEVNDALQVVVDSNGQLGTVSSSRRGKREVAAIGGSSERLHALRPVSFRYIAHDDGGPPQFGLIAEEVAEVLPELVVLDAEGRPETVRYQALDALLLNELQRMARRLEALERQRCAAAD